MTNIEAIKDERPGDMTIELGVCEVPNIHQAWEEPLPTKVSWQAAASIGITHVRMDYNVARLPFFEPAFRLAHDSGMRITANMTLDLIEAVSPQAIATASFDMAQHYGAELEAASFGNEYGRLLGMSPQAPVLDISQGGTFDFIKEVIGPRLLAFMRGARRAKSDILFELFDSDSTDVQQRSMALLNGTEFESDPRIYWTAHNYADAAGDSSKGDPAGQDYSSMAGMNGKPGFLSVFESDPLHREWLISEISKVTGPFGGIATPSDMDVMIRYSKMMLDKYPQCRRINFLTAKYFFTRVEVQPWLNPKPTWSTWTFGEPVVSEKGGELAGLFMGHCGGPTVDSPKTTMPVGRHRAVGK